MAKLSGKALRKRDAARDIGAELLASVREMKAGQAGHVNRGEPKLTLAQKLAAFDPALHGGQVMATRPIGNEVL